MNRFPRTTFWGMFVLGTCFFLAQSAHNQAPVKCTGECKRTFYYKITNVKLTSISDASGTVVPKTDEKYGGLEAEIGKRQMVDNLISRLQSEGKVVVDCKKGCICKLPNKPKWSNDDKKGTNKGTDSHSVTERVASQNGDATWTFDVDYTAKQDLTGKCEGWEAKTISQTSLLPEGAVFVTASVTEDTKIQVEQPGYAVIATAEVLSTKRVNPGDQLDASTTSSIQFDDGTGAVIKVLKKTAIPFGATVGLIPLLTRDHGQPMPLNNGSVTTFIGSDQPFSTPAIAIDNVNKTPEKTGATFLNSKGEKVGQLCTFTGLQPQPTSNIAIRTLDSTGAVLQEGKVTGGILDGTPKATFNKPEYHAGEKGQLQIGNQENYKTLVEMTRFGGSENVSQEPIHIIELSDVKGLPSEVPFGTTTLNFQTTHAGHARVAVIMPRSVPPKPVANPGKDKLLKESNDKFEQWLGQFPK